MGFTNRLKNFFKSKEEKHDSDDSMGNEMKRDSKSDESINNQINEDMTYDFSYLSNLINSSEKTIVLDADIIIGDDENAGITVDVDDLTIDGNGHVIDSKGKSSIFVISGKNITLRNLTFKNAYGDLKGSAVLIMHYATVSIENCQFLNNQSKYGGAISNYGDINLKNVVFKANYAEKGGGAIFNNEGSLVASNVKFYNNKSYLGGAIGNYSKIEMHDSYFNENHADFEGGAIYNNPGAILKVSKTDFIENNSVKSIVHNLGEEVFFFDCNFLKNDSDYGIIDNQDVLKFFGCNFDFNNAQYVIKNSNDSDLSIQDGEFTNNNSNLTVIHNIGKDCSIANTTFKNNVSELESAVSILNETELSLQALKLESYDKTITNKGKIKLRRFSIEDADKFINNQGTLEYFDIPGDNPFNFVYLENLIYDAYSIDEDEYSTVYLNSDIVLDNYEVDFYEGGIELDMDDLIIDGNHHIIDANNNSRIFLVSGCNITLRNIIFKNAKLINKFSEHTTGGGAIKIVYDGSLTLENCEFIDNYSDDDGGAILNNGVLTSKNSKFENNQSQYYGGAIYNKYEFSTTNDEYVGNKSKMAGAIYSINLITIDGINVADNYSKLSQPIFSSNLVKAQNILYDIDDLIYNVGDINQKGNSIETFTYLKNMIVNSNNINFKQDIIFDYDVDEDLKQGILINKTDEIVIDGHGFSIDGKNESALFKITNNARITFKNITFKGLFSDDLPIIENDGEIVFEDCKFINNKANSDSNLIKNNHSLKLINSSFSNNGSANQSLIDNKSQLDVLNCDFISNSSNSDGGVISNYKSMEISESKFNENASKNNGGAIYNYVESVLNISNSTFVNNHASVEGGSVINLGNLQITGCHFEENISKNTGGAIYNVNLLKIKNTNFIKNNSNFGGAIANMGKINLENTQFRQNTSNTDGAALNNQGQIKISGCEFKDNDAGNYGGAISNISTIDIDDSVFINNSSIRDGGAINCSLPKSSLKITNSRFNKNNSNFGGVISNFGRVILIDCKFEENHSIERGGVLITAKNSNVSIANSDFICNSSIHGGAILSSGFISMTNSRFIKNKAKVAGGAIYNNTDGSIEGSNNEFSDNSIDQMGGAIANFSIINFKEIIFKNNSSYVGGAIYNEQNSSLSISNSKFFNNKASETGGGIYTYDDYDFCVVDCEFDINSPQDMINSNGYVPENQKRVSSSTKQKVEKMTDVELGSISRDFESEGIDEDENALKDIIKNDSDIHRKTVALICLVNLNDIYNEESLQKFCIELKNELNIKDDDFELVIETLNSF